MNTVHMLKLLRRKRWRQQQELGEVAIRSSHRLPAVWLYADGCSSCILTSSSTSGIKLYFINDYGPGVRRVYIGQEHKNVYGTYPWYGDTIGFWDGNKLVTSTKHKKTSQ